MKRTVFTLILVTILLVVGGIIYYVYNKPPVNVESEKSSIHIKAVDLFNKYSENEDLADSLYLNKVVQVEGDVNEVDTDQRGEKMLILKEEDDLFGVVCSLDESEAADKEQARMVKIGDHVVVKGICSGFDQEVKLNKCVIVSIGKPARGI